VGSPSAQAHRRACEAWRHEELELELPELTRDAIVSFDVAPHEQECGLDSCSEVPALIDDLRLE